MKAFWLWMVCTLVSSSEVWGQSGTIAIIDTFHSTYIDSRQVEIRLPASYFTSPRKRYPVIYMTDGQNVFNAATSYTHVAWGVDKALDSLERQGKVQECIVVAVWNNGSKRFLEYMPDWLDLAGANTYYDKKMNDAPSKELCSRAYLTFLVEELKPFIDKNYRTKANRRHTCLMGSSMGGLFALYAICEYPLVFGKAACVSTHWPVTVGRDDAFLKLLLRKLPSPRSHKIYFDCGNKTLDELYPPLQSKADGIMRVRGYREGRNWTTAFYEGAEHTEMSWSRRMPEVLSFLLGIY